MRLLTSRFQFGWYVLSLMLCNPVTAAPPVEVPEGYMVELVAGPPLVGHPMMAAFDDRGRLFVTESAGVNLPRKQLEEQLPHSIRMLEDTDGDGVFDRVTVFADRLTFPQGAVWHDGWLYAAVSGGVWRFADTDDDGVADVRQQLVDGFGYFGNAADVHGCFLHPGGRIYWVDGRQGHKVTDEGGQVISESRIAGGVFSILPDGRDFRQHATGGFANPVELVFTDAGEALGTVNILYNNPREDGLVHWVEGGVYPPQENLGAWGPFTMTGDPLPGVLSFGHVAVSGLTRLRAEAEDGAADRLLVTFFNRNRVVSVDVERQGASFAARFEDFLWSPDIDFHPTDVLEDADGSVLVIDTGGWFSMGCPTSKIAKPQIKGAIYRVRRNGAPPVADPRGLQLDWDRAVVADLVQRLDDARPAVRDRAITALSKRGAEAVAMLKERLTDDRAALRVRRNALWALARTDAAAADGAARLGLGDVDESVRQAAAHIAGMKRDAAALERLMQMLTDDAPPVTREAASSLGLIGRAQAVPAILERLGAAADRVTEHALIYALIDIDDAVATSAGLGSGHPAVQRGALTALDQMPGGTLEPGPVLAAMRSSDEPLRAAALDIFTRRKEWAAHAAALLEKLLIDGESAGHGSLAQPVLAAFIREEPVAELAGRLLDASDLTTRSTILVLQSIAASGVEPVPASWLAPLGRRITSADAAIALHAIDATGLLRIDAFDESLARVAADGQRTREIRLAAARSMALRGRSLAIAAFELLADELAAHRPVERRRDAARLLASADLTADQQRQLVAAVANAGPVELPLILQCFESGAPSELATAVFVALAVNPARWSLPVADLERLIDSFGTHAPAASRAMLAELHSAAEAKDSRLTELESTTATGEAERGRAIFHGKGTCFVCHRVAGQGGIMGPDLSSIGAMRGRRDLLESIVYPSATFAQGYEAVTLPLTTGQTYYGRVARETGEAFFLIDPQGIEHRLPLSQINFFAMKRSETSLMPAGLDRLLSEQELGDLLAYLQSLR